MVPPTDSLTKLALRFRAVDRAELATILARSVAAGEPPRPAPRLPKLTLRRSRVAAGLLSVVLLGLSANYLGRLYTCAEGLLAAKQTMNVVFAVLGVVVLRSAVRLKELFAADALRLALPDRERLAEALQRSLDAEAATGRAGRQALSPRDVVVIAGLAVVPLALGAADYILRLHSCAGGAAEAKQRIIVWGGFSAIACFTYVRNALRDARAYRDLRSVREHS